MLFLTSIFKAPPLPTHSASERQSNRNMLLFFLTLNVSNRHFYLMGFKCKTYAPPQDQAVFSSSLELAPFLGVESVSLQW